MPTQQEIFDTKQTIAKALNDLARKLNMPADSSADAISIEASRRRYIQNHGLSEDTTIEEIFTHSDDAYRKQVIEDRGLSKDATWIDIEEDRRKKSGRGEPKERSRPHHIFS